MYVCMYVYVFIVPSPRVFLMPNHLQQGIIGEAHELVCLIAISSVAQPNLVNLTWNFTSNDNRVTVIPTTITTDDSIGIIYTTVVQFSYLKEGDEGNYTCAVTIEENSGESTFNLQLIRKHMLNSIVTYVQNKYVLMLFAHLVSQLHTTHFNSIHC